LTKAKEENLILVVRIRRLTF